MKKKKKKFNIQTERVLPTPEFLKKHEVIEKQTNRAGEKRLYVTDQLWIDTYFKKDIINYDQHQTAIRFLSLFKRAGRVQKVTMSFSKERIDKTYADTFNLSSEAFADYNKIKRLMGSRSFDCVQDVICFNLSAKEWAIKNSRNVKASAEIFRLSLDDLADAFKSLKS